MAVLLLSVPSYVMDNPPHVKLSFLCWNVQGLGGVDKCDVVRDSINTVDPVVACIQESKLSELSITKARSFLPSRPDSYVAKDANGSRGGVTTLKYSAKEHISTNQITYLEMLLRIPIL